MRILAAVVVACMVLGCAKKQEVILGGVFPMSGGAATFGKSSKQGMQMKIDEWNAKGGVSINGKKTLVKAYYEDSEGLPEKAANAIQKLISQDKINGLVGEVMSKNSLAMAPICQQAKVPMITSSSTNPGVTLVGDFIYRACFIDPFQGSVIAKYVYDNLGLKKAAVIYDNANDYNKGLAEFFRSKFESMGGKVVAYEAFNDEQKVVDYKAQLTNVKASGAEFLMLPNYYASVALTLKQARELGLKMPAGGGDGWDSPDLVKIGGAAVEGGFFVNHFSKDDPNQVVQNFVQQYKQKFNDAPDALATLAYDACGIMLSAIDKAGSVDGTAIKDAMKGIEYDGVSGKIRFDENRNPIKAAVILKIEGGVQKYLATVAP